MSGWRYYLHNSQPKRGSAGQEAGTASSMSRYYLECTYPASGKGESGNSGVTSYDGANSSGRSAFATEARSFEIVRINAERKLDLTRDCHHELALAREGSAFRRAKADPSSA